MIQENIFGIIGKVIGFIFSYFLFTTVLFFVLIFIKKIPSDWLYCYLMFVTMIITCVGAFIRKVIK